MFEFSFDSDGFRNDVTGYYVRVAPSQYGFRVNDNTFLHSQYSHGFRLMTEMLAMNYMQNMNEELYSPKLWGAISKCGFIPARIKTYIRQQIHARLRQRFSDFYYEHIRPNISEKNLEISRHIYSSAFTQQKIDEPAINHLINRYGRRWFLSHTLGPYVVRQFYYATDPYLVWLNSMPQLDFKRTLDNLPRCLPRDTIACLNRISNKPYIAGRLNLMIQTAYYSGGYNYSWERPNNISLPDTSEDELRALFKKHKLKRSIASIYEVTTKIRWGLCKPCSSITEAYELGNALTQLEQQIDEHQQQYYNTSSI